MDTSNIKYFMYTRKSRDEDDRQIRSLDDQAADLAEIIEKRGLKVVDKLKESQSAKVKGRPVFNDMLRRIEAGEASGIIAWHPDRLARNAFDGGYIIDLIDGKKIVDLQFYDFWFQNNSQGKAMLADAFTRSKYYSDNLSDVIGRAMRRKRAEGIWPGFSPIGYLNDPITKGIIVDSVRGPLVRKAFEIYAAEACTLDELTARVNALGLTCRPTKKHPSAPLSRSQYHRILTNPIYIGILEHGGEVRPGAHEPLIEKSLFDRVQEIVSGKRKPRLKRPVKSYLYRRTFACGECDCCITNETQKGHVYLRCTKKRGSCSQPFVREDYVSQKIDAALAKLIVPRDWIDFMQSELETELQQQHDSTHDHRKTLLQKLAVCDQKQKRLVEAYAEGILKLEEFGQAKETIDYERLTLKEQLRQLEKCALYWLEPTRRFVTTLFEATLTIQGEDTEAKANLFKKTGSNLKIQSRKIEFDFRGAWETVEKHGRLAQQHTATSCDVAVLVGKSDDVSHPAERARFELA